MSHTTNTTPHNSILKWHTNSANFKTYINNSNRPMVRSIHKISSITSLDKLHNTSIGVIRKRLNKIKIRFCINKILWCKHHNIPLFKHHISPKTNLIVDGYNLLLNKKLFLLLLPTCPGFKLIAKKLWMKKVHVRIY